MMRKFVKERIRDTFDNPESEQFVLVNSAIGAFAVASVVLALSALFPYFHRYETIFFWVDWVTTVFFTVEYALRLWIAEKKWAYVQSPLGLIDLVSFVPTYLGLGNFAFLKAVRFIRIARLSRVANVTNVTKVLPKKE